MYHLLVKNNKVEGKRLKLGNFCFKRLPQNLIRGRKTALFVFFFIKKKKKPLNLTCLFSKGTDKAQPAAKSGKENQEKSK